jgi:O-antigen ligase
MALKFVDRTNKFWLESLILLVIFIGTWIGYGTYLAGVIIVAFLFALFFINKREIIFRDRSIIALLILFTINNVISSLLSIDILKSTLLSLVGFFWIFIPYSYAQFGVNKENNFFIKVIIPISFFISCFIILYLLTLFFKDVLTEAYTSKTVKRYTALHLGKATTPDTLIMLGGFCYGWLRQKSEKRYLWFGFLYLLFSFMGVILTFDRGSVVAFFIMMVLLLSFDYKRLILLFVVFGLVIAATFILESLEKYQHLFNYLYNRQTWSRLATHTQLASFSGAWEMIKDHWLMGVGTNNFSKVVKQYSTGRWFAYAHNFIMQFWAENGLFGMIFGLSIMGLVIYRWLKSMKLYKYKYIALGIGVSIVGLLIGNLTNSTLWILKISLPFWMLAGTMSSIYFVAQKENN